MNKIMLVGNVVKDCELQYVGKDKNIAKATFTLACNERLGKEKELCNFIPCTIWSGMAESLAGYLTKGTKIAVSGRLDINTVEGEYEGEYKTYVNVNVADLDFCGSANKGSEGEKPTKDSKPRREEKPKRK